MVKSEDRRLLIGLRRSKTLYSVIIGRKADTSTPWVRLILLANRSEHRVRRGSRLEPVSVGYQSQVRQATSGNAPSANPNHL